MDNFLQDDLNKILNKKLSAKKADEIGSALQNSIINNIKNSISELGNILKNATSRTEKQKLLQEYKNRLSSSIVDSLKDSGVKLTEYDLQKINEYTDKLTNKFIKNNSRFIKENVNAISELEHELSSLKKKYKVTYEAFKEAVIKGADTSIIETNIKTLENEIKAKKSEIDKKYLNLNEKINNKIENLSKITAQQIAESRKNLSLIEKLKDYGKKTYYNFKEGESIKSFVSALSGDNLDFESSGLFSKLKDEIKNLIDIFKDFAENFKIGRKETERFFKTGIELNAAYGASLNTTLNYLKDLHAEFGSSKILGNKELKLLSESLDINVQNAKFQKAAFYLQGSAEMANKAFKELAMSSLKYGVNINTVMETIASNYERIYLLLNKTSQQTVQKLVPGLKALGVNLESVLNLAERTIDSLEDSIEKELKLSLMLGKHIDFNRFRMAAFTGDAKAQTKALLEIIDKLDIAKAASNVFAKKSIEEALGMSFANIAEIKKNIELAKQKGINLSDIDSLDKLEKLKYDALHFNTQIEQFNKNIEKLKGYLQTALIPILLVLNGVFETVNITLNWLNNLLQKGYDYLKNFAAPLGKISDYLGNLGKVLTGIIGLTSGIFLFSKAFSFLGTLMPKVAKFIGESLKVVGEYISKFLEALGKNVKNAMAGGATLIMLSSSLLLLAIAINKFKDVDLETFGKSLIAFGSYIVAFMGIMKILSFSKLSDSLLKDSIKLSLAIAVISGGIFLLSKALGEFNKLDFETVYYGIGVLIAFTGIAASLGFAIKYIALGAAAIILLGTSIIILGLGLKTLGKGLQEIFKSFILVNEIDVRNLVAVGLAIFSLAGILTAASAMLLPASIVFFVASKFLTSGLISIIKAASPLLSSLNDFTNSLNELFKILFNIENLSNILNAIKNIGSTLNEAFSSIDLNLVDSVNKAILNFSNTISALALNTQLLNHSLNILKSSLEGLKKYNIIEINEKIKSISDDKSNIKTENEIIENKNEYIIELINKLDEFIKLNSSKEIIVDLNIDGTKIARAIAKSIKYNNI